MQTGPPKTNLRLWRRVAPVSGMLGLFSEVRTSGSCSPGGQLGACWTAEAKKQRRVFRRAPQGRQDQRHNTASRKGWKSLERPASPCFKVHFGGEGSGRSLQGAKPPPLPPAGGSMVVESAANQPRSKAGTSSTLGKACCTPTHLHNPLMTLLVTHNHSAGRDKCV